MKIKQKLFLPLFATTIWACHSNNKKADAYGNFESTEVVVSAMANGQIKAFHINEGDQLQKGDTIGYVDTTQLYLKKEQLTANKAAIAKNSGNIAAQVEVLLAQKSTLEKDQKRFSNLLKDSAITQKQMDDLNGQLAVVNKKIKSIEVQNAPLVYQIKAVDMQIAQVNNNISQSYIISPVSGTVLAKYAEQGETAAFGKPLFSIANLDTIILRAYISEKQLANLKLRDQVKVLYDKGDGIANTTGKVSWISSSAEFTPKIVQTKEDRVNLVYAIKVKVKNNGDIKIGMPGEVYFENGQ